MERLLRNIGIVVLKKKLNKNNTYAFSKTMYAFLEKGVRVFEKALV